MGTAKIDESPALSIVVATDFSATSGLAFDAGARLASRVPWSELHLVHVFDAEPSRERMHELVAHLRLYIDEKAAITSDLKGVQVRIHLRSGKPVREIAQLAVEVCADLIVVGSHGSERRPHVKSWLLGSTAERLVASASCPVLIAAPKPAAVEKLEPAIEPPCLDCVRARTKSAGAAWWCERHSHHAERAHTFSYQRELPFASHDSEVTPTGVDM